MLLFMPGGGTGKPVLYVVESSSCMPCRQLQHAWTHTPGFAERIGSKFDVRALRWENAEHRAFAQQMGVTALPSFIAMSPSGQRLAMIEGFTSELDLLNRLGLRPLTRQISQQTQRPTSSQESTTPAQGVPSPQPRTSATDESARREIQRLEQSIQSLQRQLRDVGKAPESSAELQSLRKTVEELKAAATSQLQTQRPVTPILTTEPQSVRRSSGLMALALKAGATLLLPEVAIPTGAISIAATIGGWWLGRRRRNPRLGTAAPSGSDQHSVTVLRDTTTRQNTANHFIVKETEKVGEAYKEAIRRITAAYKSEKPGIVDVASQIEHVAQEILRGQSVTARDSQVPRPGLWTDED
jgi:prefoldin subunit 5